jgi:hypothetical protein
VGTPGASKIPASSHFATEDDEAADTKATATDVLQPAAATATNTAPTDKEEVRRKKERKPKTSKKAARSAPAVEIIPDETDKKKGNSVQ